MNILIIFILINDYVVDYAKKVTNLLIYTRFIFNYYKLRS